MRILAVGDVVSRCGVDYIANNLKKLIKEKEIDFTVVNGENAFKGKGISKEICDILFDSGADCITLGNHAFSKKSVKKAFETYPSNVLRPINMGDDFSGKGHSVISKNGVQVGVVNAIGRIYMAETCDPFLYTDKALKEMENEGVKIIIADFHAEATSEKLAFGHYFDGRISAVFGTHTHVPTADAKILRGGTGYITDVGMTGSKDGILGLKKESSINKIVFNITEPFEWCETNPSLNGVVFDVCEDTGKCINIERIDY